MLTERFTMIVVFGSINADLVIEVASLPGPGETRLAPEYNAVPGGKGANQALAAKRAGGCGWLLFRLRLLHYIPSSVARLVCALLQVRDR